VLAILLGFIPATIVASAREDGAFASIDRAIKDRYANIYSMDDWKALDPMLAHERTHKRDTRQSIALGSLAIWAAAGGAVAYAWFSLLAPRLARPPRDARASS
jgi:hypothetical protein